MKFILVFALFLTGCGIDQDVTFTGVLPRKEPNEPMVVPDDSLPLLFLLEEFQHEAALRDVKMLTSLSGLNFVEGHIDPTKPAIIARCKYNIRDGKRKNSVVEFGTTWWVSLSDIYRKTVSFHEFGHCLLYRPHYDGTFQVDGVQYKSMMNTFVSIGNNAAQEKKWPILLDELFRPDSYHTETVEGGSLVHHTDCSVNEKGDVVCDLISDGITFQ